MASGIFFQPLSSHLAYHGVQQTVSTVRYSKTIFNKSTKVIMRKGTFFQKIVLEKKIVLELVKHMGRKNPY